MRGNISAWTHRIDSDWSAQFFVHKIDMFYRFPFVLSVGQVSLPIQRVDSAPHQNGHTLWGSSDVLAAWREPHGRASQEQVSHSTQKKMESGEIQSSTAFCVDLG